METSLTLVARDLIQINDTIWYWYSALIMFFPYNTICIYKLVNPIDYTRLSDTKKTFKKHKEDVFLMYASMLACARGFSCSFTSFSRSIMA